MTASIRCIVAHLVLLSLLLTGCASSSTTGHTAAHPDQSDKLKALDDTSAAIYEQVKAGQYAEARNLLEQFTVQMTQITYSGITSPEGLNALTELVTQSRRVFNRVKLSPAEAKLAAVQIRLAADALIRQEQPMWRAYRSVFKRDAEHLEAALSARDTMASRQSLRSLYAHYRVIRPAMLISLSPTVVEKADSWFVYMNRALAAKEPDFRLATEGKARFNELLAEWFGNGAAAASLPIEEMEKPVWKAVLLALAICSVLVYVAWKKYRFTKGWG